MSRLWADDVDGVLRALALDRPVLCGWSHGPLVILDYIRHYGEQAVAGMAFIDGITRLGGADAASVLTPESLGLVPGFFSEEVEERVQSLRSLLRLGPAKEPATEVYWLIL